MSKRNKTSTMIELTLITAIAIVFALAAIYIPLAGVLTMFLPVPFIVIGVKNGLKYTVLSLMMATAMIGIFTGSLSVVLMLVTAWLVSIVLVYMIEKKYSFKSIIFFGSIASIASVIVSLAIMPKVFGFGPLEMIEQSFVKMVEMYTRIFETSGVDTEKVEQVIDSIKLMKDFILIIFPSTIIMTSIVSTYFNYLLSGVILRKIGFSIEKQNKFGYFRLPSNFMMGALVIVILTYLSSRFNIVKSDALNANILYLFQYVFIILGLAVVSFFLERKRIGNVLRRTILIFILLIPSASLILFFVGLFDVVFNIRKLGT